MGAAITEAKSFASLGPMLLARKGTAKPAMRAMLGQSDRMAELSDDLDDLARSQAELGWNDLGGHDTVVQLPLARGRTVREATTAAKGRVAFTLRLDAERHMKLRLAGTMQGASAQVLVTEALDRFLATMPEIDAIAAKMRRRDGRKG